MFLKDYLVPVLVGVSSAGGFAFITWVIGKMVIRFVLPKELNNRMSQLEAKFDSFLLKYDDGASRNKKSQMALFRIQDYQFDVMKAQTGAVRELAKSVCNGNKAEALRLCEESEDYIKNGKDIHRSVAIGGGL